MELARTVVASSSVGAGPNARAAWRSSALKRVVKLADTAADGESVGGAPGEAPSPAPAPAPAYSPEPELVPYSPDYVDSQYYEPEDEGYSYPKPANPLVLPTKAPVVASTYAPISVSPAAENGYVPDAANGGNYVEPSGISSTYRTPPAYTPAPQPAYGLSSTYSPVTLYHSYRMFLDIIKINVPTKFW